MKSDKLHYAEQDIIKYDRSGKNFLMISQRKTSKNILSECNPRIKGATRN